MDIENLMKQAQEMQKKMSSLQEEASAKEVIGESGGGLIKVTMNGRYDVRKVDVDASVLSEEKEFLEDLLAAAVNDAVRRVEENNQNALSSLTGGIGLPSGFKMPFS